MIKFNLFNSTNKKMPTMQFPIGSFLLYSLTHSPSPHQAHLQSIYQHQKPSSSQLMQNMTLVQRFISLYNPAI